ncbi:MAG: hypothetical protein GC164_06655 [Phycisphaera sp.]|nr:hypothetical protein [Phycisphaera sp.]
MSDPAQRDNPMKPQPQPQQRFRAGRGLVLRAGAWLVLSCAPATWADDAPATGSPDPNPPAQNATVQNEPAKPNKQTFEDHDGEAGLERDRPSRDRDPDEGVFDGDTDRPQRDRVPGRGPDKKPDDGPVTPQQLNQRLEVLREIHPQLAKQLEALREKNPERVAQMLRQHWPRLQEIVDTRESDPEFFNLRVSDIRLTRERMDLIGQFRKATRSSNITTLNVLRDQLLANIQEHFEVRQEMRRKELEQLESRVTELKQKLDDREKQRDQIINDYFNSITTDSK